MTPVTKSDDAVSHSVLLRKQRLLIRLQLLLIAALIAVVLRVNVETRRANFWQAEAARLMQAEQGAPTIAEVSARQDTNYYKTTLISEDGSETPLDGKAVRIDHGDKRITEIRLNRMQDGYLHIWAPARREDNYFNRVVFHPGCANSFYLQLIQVKLKDADSSRYFADVVTYEPPR